MCIYAKPSWTDRRHPCTRGCVVGHLYNIGVEACVLRAALLPHALSGGATPLQLPHEVQLLVRAWCERARPPLPPPPSGGPASTVTLTLHFIGDPCCWARPPAPVALSGCLPLLYINHHGSLHQVLPTYGQARAGRRLPWTRRGNNAV